MATYHVTALEMPIYFNREGDHDHTGLIFAPTDNVPILKFIRALGAPAWGNPEDWRVSAEARPAEIGVETPRNGTAGAPTASPGSPVGASRPEGRRPED